jgi:multicomponent Na+:H+ antiporter subunit E
MNILLLNLLLAFAWTFLTGNLDFENFFAGVIIGYFILLIGRKSLDRQSYFKRLPKIALFILYFFKELIKANLLVAYDILTPRDYMKPGIIAFEMSAKTDLEITLLANLITLTPGTLSLDTSNDNKVLFIHSMYLDDVDEFKESIKNGLEKKLLEILR